MIKFMNQYVFIIVYHRFIMNLAYITLLTSVLLVGKSFSNMCEEIANRTSTETDYPDVTALILARGGSKGIPLKNIARIRNQTLLGRTLDTIHNFTRFNGVWVSTDNEVIAEVARKRMIFIISLIFIGFS